MLYFNTPWGYNEAMEKTYEVKGMTCVICKGNVEKALNNLEGVEIAKVNLLENEVTVKFSEEKLSDTDLQKAVKNAGYDLILEKKYQKVDYDLLRLFVVIILTLTLMYVSMSSMHHPTKTMYTQMVLALIIILINNNFFTSGFRSLIHLSPNMDSLVSLSSSISYLYSLYAMYRLNGDMTADYHLYFETAAMIPTFVLIGKTIEGKSKQKTTKVIRGLATLIPMQANKLDENGNVSIIRIEDLRKNDIVRVLPGESIPQDGIVINGATSIDESMITGESLPVNKKVDDLVIGGTINTTGTIDVKINKNANMTVLSSIINLTKKATMKKIPIERFADAISKYFVFGVLSIALITFVTWILISKDIELALNFALSVLVISCPCALGLATPSAIAVATGTSAKNGILIKKPEVLEIIGKLKNIVFDKTGTLTKNKLSVVDNEILNDEFINVLTSLESYSNHPIAKAILENYPKGDLNFDTNDFVAGEGIIAKIGKDNYLAGNALLLKNNGIELDEKYIDKAINNNYSFIAVCKNKNLLGIVYITDILRDTSKITIDNLKKRNIKPIMCTGDNQIAASKIAKIIGIDEYLAEVKPNDKNALVSKLKEEGIVAMVGDGVNDAIALTSADISISIKNASDIAFASSDVILMKSDLNDISFLYDLAKKTMRVIKQNMFWALFYNALFIPVAAGVLYPSFGFKLNPMIGAATMALSSIFVLSNALRIGNLKKEEIKFMNKTVLIEGMMCNNCRKHAEEALKALGCDVTVSLEDKKAYIKNSAVDDVTITKAIEDAGYEVVQIVNE